MGGFEPRSLRKESLTALLYPLSYIPITDASRGYQTSHAFWEGVGSRRLYALGFRLHYNILKTENRKKRKNLCRLHKVLIFLPHAVRRCPSPHLNRHFSPLIRKDKLIPKIPQTRMNTGFLLVCLSLSRITSVQRYVQPGYFQKRCWQGV